MAWPGPWARIASMSWVCPSVGLLVAAAAGTCLPWVTVASTSSYLVCWTTVSL